MLVYVESIDHLILLFISCYILSYKNLKKKKKFAH